MLNVLSFGGGVGELFLMLAKAEGHNAFFCSGQPGAPRRAREARHRRHRPEGVQPLQEQGRRQGVPQASASSSPSGEDMHIVCDMLRGPVFDAGPRGRGALRRERQRRLAALAGRHLQLDR